MSTFGAKRLARFPEYVFSRLAKQVREVERDSGRKVLSFGAGSPDIRPSDAYLGKFSEFIAEPDSHLYPPYGGIPEFTHALIAFYKRRFNVALAEDEVFPLLGAKDGVCHLPLALADEGDEMLVPDPGYPAFSGAAELFGIQPVAYDLKPENKFAISLEELESKRSARTKCMWVNFPSNPTGAVATFDELEAVVGFSKRHAIPIMYDNAYAEITFDGLVAPSILQIPGAIDTCVELGSFSKSFSFAGFRMGWIAGNKDIIAALAKVKSQADSGMSLPLQRLGAFALSNPDEKWHAEMIESYRIRRDIIAGKLRPLGLSFELPKGSLYIWARIPGSAKDSESFCMELLREKQILLAPGNAFGKNGERYVRVSICVNIDRIDEYF